MRKSAFHILRVGVAITFLWIAVLIFKDPEAWGGLLKPWASNLLPIPLAQAMIGTAILDLLVGAFLLVDQFTLSATALGFIHLVIVIATVGIDASTVRDIGLLAATLALLVDAYPYPFKPKSARDFLTLLLK